MHVRKLRSHPIQKELRRVAGGPDRREVAIWINASEPLIKGRRLFVPLKVHCAALLEILHRFRLDDVFKGLSRAGICGENAPAYREGGECNNGEIGARVIPDSFHRTISW